MMCLAEVTLTTAVGLNGWSKFEFRFEVAKAEKLEDTLVETERATRSTTEKKGNSKANRPRKLKEIDNKSPTDTRLSTGIKEKTGQEVFRPAHCVGLEAS